MWAVIYVPERQVSAVSVNDVVVVEVPALPGRQVLGRVERVGSSVDHATRAVPVRVSLANEDGVLKPEMSARATIRVDAHPMVTVPTSALMTRADGGYSVFVRLPALADPRHPPASPWRYERRNVTLGAELEDRAQIVDGLHEGEQIVVDGVLLIDSSAQQML